MNYRTLRKILEDEGWKARQGKGSHLVMKHPEINEAITLKYLRPGEQVKQGALAMAKRIAGLKV